MKRWGEQEENLSLQMSITRKEGKQKKRKKKVETAAASQIERKATVLILWPTTSRTHRN